MTDVIHKYQPRKQFISFHERSNRWSLLVCHRRAGKSVAVINDMLVRALRTQKPNAFFAYVAPYMGQARNIAWNYIVQYSQNIPGIKISLGDLSVTLPNGAKIKLFGADNAEALRGLYFDGIVCDEYANFKPGIFNEIIRPALSDRKGWCVFVGTPAGKQNAFYANYIKAKSDPKWFFLELTADKSGIIPKEELVSLQEELDPSEFAQEFLCSFEAALRGAYYGSHMAVLEDRGHITDISQDLNLPVQIAIDLGTRDACAIWFWQYKNGQVNIIDYFEETGFDAEEIIDVLDFKTYQYERVWLPHDALHKTFRSKKSVMDVFRAANLPCARVPNPDAGNRVLHGINAVRNVLRTWPIYFDKTKCARGIEALKNYSRKYNPVTKVFDSNPSHDENSHGADAFRYMVLSLNREQMMNSTERKERTVVINIPQTIKITLNDLFAHREQQQLARQSDGQERI